MPSGSAFTSPGYRWYKDEIGFNTTYGAYYNALAIDTSRNGNKNVCLTGWHVPVETEWDTLITYLGGEEMAGGKLKEMGNYFWKSAPANWTWATNESGFTALPGGYCDYANFYSPGVDGYWWSGGSPNGYKTLYLDYRNPRAEVIGPLYIPSKEYRFISVRCLKDN